MTAIHPTGRSRRGVLAAAVTGLALACFAGTVALLDRGHSGSSARPAPKLPVTSASPSASLGSLPTQPPSTPTPATGTPAGRAGPAGGLPRTAVPTPERSAAPAQQSAPAAGSTQPFPGGSYRVGVDVAAGTWQTGGAVNLNLTPCQYRIDDGPVTAVTIDLGPTRVQLRAGQTFWTAGCAEWRYVS